jgi:hypothetical protein
VVVSAWLEDQVGWVGELLDILDGSDHLSREESSSAPSGPGPAGYEPCQDCQANKRLGWPYCPVCDDTKWVKTGGDYDPYLRERDPVIHANGKRGPIPIYPGEWTEENTPRIMEAMFTRGNVTVPSIPERVSLTTVERTAARFVGGRTGAALTILETKLQTAPVWVTEGANLRERDALVWLAKRLAEAGARVR